MAYYSGQSSQPVKPVKTRPTQARKIADKKPIAHLQRTGRKPINRRGYPSLGVPVSIDMSMRPGSSFLGTPVNIDMAMRPGSSFLGALNVLPQGFTGFQSTYTPGSGSSQPASSGGIFDSLTSGLTSLVNLWNNRPEELKKIRIRVNPQQVMQTVQQAIPAKTVSSAVDKLKSYGMDPRLLVAGGEVPFGGTEAGLAYRASSVDWQAYLPWIVGGGIALFAIPMILRK